MEYRFFLDDLEVDEPIGWDTFELSMKRDEKYHGMQFEASTGTLRFIGPGAEYLRNKKNDEGIAADVLFTAEISCGDEEFEEIYVGRLNFGKYKDSCGEKCIVSIPAEEQSCAVMFKNRFDQKADVDNLVAFDKITNLPDYARLNFPIELRAQNIQVSLDVSVSEEGDTVSQTGLTAGNSTTLIRPTYIDVRFNSINTGNPQPTNNFRNTDFFDTPITPQILYEETDRCFDGEFSYNIRMKGTYNITGVGQIDLELFKFRLVTWDGNGEINNDSTQLGEVIFFSGGAGLPETGSFDGTLSGNVTLTEGIGLYAYIEIKTNEFDPILPAILTGFNVTFDEDTSFLLEGVKSCEPTDADAYLVHETLSRVAESVTNLCVRAKSEYYGRIDSQPFSFDSDGCGSLRMLTSGLKIRNAPEDKFFASLKDLIEGLNAIDNIGFAIENDPDRAGKSLLRIEPVAYWYRDAEILSFDGVAEGSSEVLESNYYSKVLVGYKKWEVESVNGLGEFNSTREYRTSLETVSNQLDITSNLVAGGFPIEITRQQSFAETGAADTKYDNDIFIITLRRLVYDFEVEQGGIDSPENIFDPDTVYNFRLSPARNLMRWYKSIINSYASLGGSENKLFFSAGTGNLTAKGEITVGAYDALCKIESMPIQENQDLFTTHFARIEDATPLWKNETISFEYPLSIAEWRTIKANPYGYINVQCGNGAFEKAFVKEIKYRISGGKANFTLLKKWE